MSFPTSAVAALCVRNSSSSAPCLSIEHDRKPSTSVVLHGDHRKSSETVAMDVVVDASVCGIEDTSRVCYAALCDRFGAALAEGYNTGLITYGQTAMGKTAVMFGSGLGDHGVAGRVLQDTVDLFGTSAPLLETSLTTTAVEMANDRVRDLLDSQGAFQDRKVRSHPELGTNFEGLTRTAITSSEDVAQLLKTIRMHRQRPRDGASTSHVIIQLQARRRDLQRGVQQMSTLSIADLAGFKSTKGSIGQGAKNIQMSLHVLRRVVELAAFASTKKDPTKSRLPVKDTALTWVLGDMLQGNGHLACMCCVSADAADIDETTKTIKFATNVRKIRAAPLRVEEKCDVVVHAIQQEMANIQVRLQATPRDRQDDLSRLQKELGFRAQQLQEEENTKLEARDALHVQVQRTDQELERVRAQLNSKREAAATAGALQAEVARLALVRDLAMKRLAEEEAHRKRTQARITAARAVEAEAERLRRDRERMEEVARSDQRDQSKKVLKNVFKVATAMERDRHMRRELEALNRRLQQRVDEVQHSIASTSSQREAIVQAMEGLQELHGELLTSLHTIERTKADVHNSVAQLAKTMSDGEVPEGTVVSCEACTDVAVSSSDSSNGDATAHLATEVRYAEDALDALRHQIDTCDDAVVGLEAQSFAKDHLIVQLEGTLERLHRGSLYLEESASECSHDVQRMDREVLFLEKLLRQCDQKCLAENGVVDEAKRAIQVASSESCTNPSKPTVFSRSFTEQKSAMQSSPYFRRFA